MEPNSRTPRFPPYIPAHLYSLAQTVFLTLMGTRVLWYFLVVTGYLCSLRKWGRFLPPCVGPSTLLMLMYSITFLASTVFILFRGWPQPVLQLSVTLLTGILVTLCQVSAGCSRRSVQEPLGCSHPELCESQELKGRREGFIRVDC